MCQPSTQSLRMSKYDKQKKKERWEKATSISFLRTLRWFLVHLTKYLSSTRMCRFLCKKTLTQGTQFIPVIRKMSHKSIVSAVQTWVFFIFWKKESDIVWKETVSLLEHYLSSTNLFFYEMADRFLSQLPTFFFFFFVILDINTVRFLVSILKIPSITPPGLLSRRVIFDLFWYPLYFWP